MPPLRRRWNNRTSVARRPLRLILAAINDRAGAARTQGRDGVAPEEILEILRKMVQQREISAVEYEEAGQIDLAQQERDEAAVILEFLPKQLDEADTKAACQAVVDELGCKGLRDMGPHHGGAEGALSGADGFRPAQAAW